MNFWSCQLVRRLSVAARVAAVEALTAAGTAGAALTLVLATSRGGDRDTTTVHRVMGVHHEQRVLQALPLILVVTVISLLLSGTYAAFARRVINAQPPPGGQAQSSHCRNPDLSSCC
jgi:hypothetical protein